MSVDLATSLCTGSLHHGILSVIDLIRHTTQQAASCGSQRTVQPVRQHSAQPAHRVETPHRGDCVRPYAQYFSALASAGGCPLYVTFLFNQREDAGIPEVYRTTLESVSQATICPACLFQGLQPDACAEPEHAKKPLTFRRGFR